MYNKLTLYLRQSKVNFFARISGLKGGLFWKFTCSTRYCIYEVRGLKFLANEEKVQLSMAV